MSKRFLFTDYSGKVLIHRVVSKWKTLKKHFPLIARAQYVNVLNYALTSKEQVMVIIPNFIVYMVCNIGYCKSTFLLTLWFRAIVNSYVAYGNYISN